MSRHSEFAEQATTDGVAPATAPSYLPGSPFEHLAVPDIPYGRPVYFPDAGTDQGLARRQEGVRERLALVLPRRQDRRGRRQRVGASRPCSRSWPVSTLVELSLGEAKAFDGIKRGYLEQEPDLDEQLDVWGNAIAWCEEKKIVDRYNAVAAKLGEDYTDELMEEMTALQEKIDAG